MRMLKLCSKHSSAGWSSAWQPQKDHLSCGNFVRRWWHILCSFQRHGQDVLSTSCTAFAQTKPTHTALWKRLLIRLFWCRIYLKTKPSPFSGSLRLLWKKLGRRIRILWSSWVYSFCSCIYLADVFRHKFHRRVIPNVDDIVPMISKYISPNDTLSSDGTVRLEAMHCLKVCLIQFDDSLQPLRWLNFTCEMLTR